MSTNNFSKSQVVQLKNQVQYQTGSIVSRIVVKRAGGNLTLFAFDKGQFLSEHTAAFDAVIQILEGEAEIVIGGEPFHLKENDTIIMPANIPHAVNALEQFKMLLTLVKD
ncbi:MAG: cupin domain-containing protein [Bacteroidales bacterium]|nr:cupin domain-containing protein [Bacteroidales bacterium]